jgi:hypothetical protein
MTASAAETFLQRTPRETLQRRGQFWTPDWVGRAMARYVLSSGARRVVDPAVGAGALLISAKSVASLPIEVAGCEIDPALLKLARTEGLTASDIAHVQVQDYLAPRHVPPEQAIVCNPPYIRHHKLDRYIKCDVRRRLEQWLGVPLDGRLGLHGYFLLRSLQQLGQGGRLAYITSADLYEGKSATGMWTVLATRFRIDGIITFDSRATPFPAVDTNPVICLMAAEPPTAHYHYLRVVRAGTPALGGAVARLRELRGATTNGDIEVQRRAVQAYLACGLARPRLAHADEAVPLGRFLRCMRGIATGANRFFFLTEQEILRRRLPREFFVRAVGRTRDVPADEITPDTLQRLDQSGRPTWLLNLRGWSREQLPAAVRAYLREGERLGVAERPLIRQRHHWYWTEQRIPPPFFFAYLGRRHVRFIRNRAGVHALNGFLYVYSQPPHGSPQAIERLWSCMRTPEFLSNLDLVAKTYGGGALKVEPRALERTPIPRSAVRPFMWGVKGRVETQLEWNTTLELMVEHGVHSAG